MSSASDPMAALERENARLRAELAEHKRVEAELRQSEERHQLIFLAATGGILVAEVESKKFRHANPAICSMLGYTEDELLKLSVMDIHPPQDIDWVVAEFMAQAHSEKTLVTNVPCIRKDGTILYVDIATRSVVLDGTTCNLGSFTDVTGRKKAEDALRESEERLQEQLRELNQVYQCSPVGLYVLDRNLRFVRINQRLAEIDGIPVEGHLGRTVSEIVPHLAERLQMLWRPIFEKGEPVLDVEVEGETAKAPGVQRHWLASYFPVKSAAGEVTGLMAAVVEITDRKRVDEALRISEVKFKALAEQSITGTCLMQDGKFVFVNPRLAEMLNFRPDEMVGLTVLDLVAEPDRDLVRENMRRRLSGEVPYARYEFHALQKGGAQVPMEVHGTVITYLGRLAIMATVLDITERIRAEQALAAANAELEARVAERTAELERASGHLRDELAERKRAEAELQALSRRFIEVQEDERRHLANELHDEIGQILTGVKLVLDRIPSLPPAEVADRLAEAQQLVGDILRRVQEMSLALRPGVLDDFGLLPALGWLFRRYTAQTGVKVVFERQLAERRFAPELETAGYRIVQEALTNVARHAGVGEASVRAWDEDGMLELEISDRGTGFDAQAALVAGNSSGLPGMRERVLLLRGSFAIRSAPGRGTEVSIRLPLRGS